MSEPENLISDARTTDALGLRDHDVRFVESLWRRYRVFAERGFVERFKDPKMTQAMFWEMYLTCVLLQDRFEVKSLPTKKGGRRGPDVLIADHNDGNKRVWFEAIAPSCGVGDDAIPDFTSARGCHDVPDREMTLRYTSALKEKREVYQRYVEKGEVKPGEACVIAINAGSIPVRFLEDGLPRIIKAVLPFGVPVAHLDLKTNRIVCETYEHRPWLHRSKGRPASTTFFDDVANSLISAVMFSYANCWLMADPPDRIGRDVIVVHNPLALVPIRKNFLTVGREFWVEGDLLKGKTMSRASPS